MIEHILSKNKTVLFKKKKKKSLQHFVQIMEIISEQNILAEIYLSLIKL